ncbi:NB-ARC domain-containing protein [Streptomyces sp. AD2-2]|nr:NB-ARC domain-containing protein [Streptomyces sp. AD2-2]
MRGPAGYRLDVTPGLVDAHRFRDLVARARRTEVPDAVRVLTLREAMGLWRGTPLAGLTGEWAGRTRESWLHQYVDAVLAWADAELRVGGHLVVIDTLSGLVAEHPLVEPLTVALMRALHAAGRTPEALTCYAGLRKRLADELGTAPGAEARQEHQALLTGKAAPRPPYGAGNGNGTERARVVPAQLPLDAVGFTGREDELARLEQVLGASGPQPSAVVVSAVSGTAGVGKTALAVHWAHRARNRFPDGQLYVNLRGYDPDRPMTAPDALVRFLTALGVSGQDIPLEPDDRAARYRTEVAGRRMLIVLDNAATVEQVRPLLPGTGSCAVLVTSRDSLAGLVVREGAQRLDLDLLPADAARTLLRRLIGPRAEAEPDAVGTLAAQCARLPLALRVAAELAAARPTTPLADLVAELADQQRRLFLLNADGDPGPPWSRCSPGRCGTSRRTRHGRSACSACNPAPTWTRTPPPRSPAPLRPTRSDRSTSSPAPTWSSAWTPPATACTTCCAPTRPGWRAPRTHRRPARRRWTDSSTTTSRPPPPRWTDSTRPRPTYAPPRPRPRLPCRTCRTRTQPAPGCPPSARA